MKEIIVRLNRARKDRDKIIGMLNAKTKSMLNHNDDFSVGDCQVLSGWVDQVYALTQTIRTLEAIAKTIGEE